jgi:DNA-binding NarL/FixJ family response regulator
MRVLLAEDHHMVRQATRLYLESRGIMIVGEATNGREAVEMARSLAPDVVIMDIHMPELTGIEATRRIRHDFPDIRVLVLTAYDEPAYVHALLEAGADGFVLKTAELPDLLKALNEVALGRTAFDSQMLERAALHDASTVSAGLSDMVESLTDREHETLVYAAKGQTNKQIGKAMFISDRTVQGHLQNIYQKLGVTTRTEAVTTALARGLLRLDGGEAT